MTVYLSTFFSCIRRIQKRKQPDRRFYSILLGIDDQKSFQCKQPSKQTLYFKKCRKMFFLDIGYSRGKWSKDQAYIIKLALAGGQFLFQCYLSLLCLGMLMFKSDRYDSILQFFFIIDFSPKKRAASTSWFNLSWRSG